METRWHIIAFDRIGDYRLIVTPLLRDELLRQTFIDFMQNQSNQLSFWMRNEVGNASIKKWSLLEEFNQLSLFDYYDEPDFSKNAKGCILGTSALENPNNREELLLEFQKLNHEEGDSALAFVLVQLQDSLDSILYLQNSYSENFITLLQNAGYVIQKKKFTTFSWGFRRFQLSYILKDWKDGYF